MPRRPKSLAEVGLAPPRLEGAAIQPALAYLLAMKSAYFLIDAHWPSGWKPASSSTL